MSTVLGVATNRGFDVALDCHHDFHLASLTPPVVGAPYDCMTCSLERWHAEHPPLSEAEVSAIEATIPHCGQCGGMLSTIPFIKHTVHKFDYTIEDREVHAGSVHDDTLDEQPDWTTRPSIEFDRARGETIYAGGEIEVQCESGHFWLEKRMVHVYDHSLHEYTWRFVPRTPEA